MTKEQIRSKISLRLKTQKEGDRDRKSRVIKNKLLRTTVFKKAKCVMFYITFDGEVQTREMIKAAQKIGKIVAAPVCFGKRLMKPCLLTEKARLKKGLYGIGEPAIKRFIDVEDLDLVVVPGLAFDEHRNRLGRGKGYYDYFLQKLPDKVSTVGLAFDFQILPTIPATKFDVKVDRLLFA